jgi:hypothetical protein
MSLSSLDSKDSVETALTWISSPPQVLTKSWLYHVSIWQSSLIAFCSQFYKVSTEVGVWEWPDTQENIFEGFPLKYDERAIIELVEPVRVHTCLNRSTVTHDLRT